NAQRIEQALLYSLFPGAAEQLAGEVSRGYEHQVVVLPQLAKRLVGLEVLQALDNLGALQCLIVIPEEVVTGKARAVAQHVARRQVFSGDGIVHPEMR